MPDDGSGDDADTLTVALLNAPSQLTAALDNFDTILALLAADDPQRATVGSTLDDATSRIASLRQTV